MNKKTIVLFTFFSLFSLFIILSKTLSAAAPLPVVSSPTHPEEEKWYPEKNATFRWSLPASVTGVNIFGDTFPNTDPGPKEDGRFSSHTFKDVSEGVHYFHIKYKDDSGWGDILHRKFQIDSQPPHSLELEIQDQTDSDEKILLIQAQDQTSGILKYEIILNDEKPISLSYAKKSFLIDHYEKGENTIQVKAIDLAGNSSTQKISFNAESELSNIAKTLPPVPKTKTKLEEKTVRTPKASLPHPQNATNTTRDATGFYLLMIILITATLLVVWFLFIIFWPRPRKEMTWKDHVRTLLRTTRKKKKKKRKRFIL